MKNSNKPWNIQDLKYIRENYFEPAHITAEKLGRSKGAIQTAKAKVTVVYPPLRTARKAREIFQWVI